MIGSELHLMAKEPPLGSHVVTPRRGYLHHGIYVGEGRVVHYSGLSRGLHRGPVEETSLLRFTRGRPVWVQLNAPSLFDSREIVRRARSRVGEDFYRLLSNNCEHFCEWCVRGEPRSFQVDELTARYSRAWRRLLNLLDRTPLLRRRSAPIDYPEAGCATTN